MDKTVIQEIANQLGIGVDRAGDFITTYLPQYAALMIWSDVFTLAVLLLMTVALGIASAKLYKHHKALRADDEWSNFDDYAAWTGVVGVLLAIAFLIAVMLLVPSIIGWACFPEAQLIHQAMGMLGR